MEESIFDPELLKKIEWKDEDLRNVASLSSLGDDLVLRPLYVTDFDRGFIELLSQLTHVGEITKKQFQERFRHMKNQKCYFITVIEDITKEKLVGTVTLLLEQKFIHSCAYKGYVEDLVVLDEYRGRNLGKLLLENVTRLSKYLGAYKVILTCKDRIVSFYEQFGYVKEKGNANLLTLRFEDKFYDT